MLRSNAPAFYSKKPDLDKLIRAIGDACSIDAPLLKDDSQIMQLHCSKRYQIGQEPCGVHIQSDRSPAAFTSRSLCYSFKA